MLLFLLPESTSILKPAVLCWRRGALGSRDACTSTLMLWRPQEDLRKVGESCWMPAPSKRECLCCSLLTFSCICLSERIGFTANVSLPHSHGMFGSFVALFRAGSGTTVHLDLVDYRLVTFRALLMLTGSLHPLLIFFSSVFMILA